MLGDPDRLGRLMDKVEGGGEVALRDAAARRGGLLLRREREAQHLVEPGEAAGLGPTGAGGMIFGERVSRNLSGEFHAWSPEWRL